MQPNLVNSLVFHDSWSSVIIHLQLPSLDDDPSFVALPLHLGYLLCRMRASFKMPSLIGNEPSASQVTWVIKVNNFTKKETSKSMCLANQLPSFPILSQKLLISAQKRYRALKN
jgi:hypothetical protein